MKERERERVSLDPVFTTVVHSRWRNLFMEIDFESVKTSFLSKFFFRGRRRRRRAKEKIRGIGRESERGKGWRSKDELIEMREKKMKMT